MPTTNSPSDPLSASEGTTKKQQITILLTEDHELYRDGLRLVLQSYPTLQLVGVAGNCTEALRLADATQPEVILLDTFLNGECSLEILTKMQEITPHSRTLMLTEENDAELHKRAIRMGAKGVFYKQQSGRLLVRAIEKIHQGEVWLDRTLTASLLSELVGSTNGHRTDPELARIATLTAREREVISMVIQGLKNKQIADQLFISETTVRHHLTSIFSKLGVANRVGLVIHSYKYQLTSKAGSAG